MINNVIDNSSGLTGPDPKKRMRLVCLPIAPKPTSGMKTAAVFHRIEDLEMIEVKENEVVLRFCTSSGPRSYGIQELDAVGVPKKCIHYKDIIVELLCILGFDEMDVVRVPLKVTGVSGMPHDLQVSN
jgi:hypothetical protein